MCVCNQYVLIAQGTQSTWVQNMKHACTAMVLEFMYTGGN